MFLKQYNYRPRSNSESSNNSMSSPKETSDTSHSGGKGASSSHNAEPGSVKGGQSSVPTPANSDMGRRRSSVSSPFSGLTNQKRTSVDGDSRKAGFMEQKPGSSGAIGQMWQNFTRGT